MNKEERRQLSIKKYGGKMKFWTDEEIEKLRRLFPDNVTEDLCDVFKRSKTSIYNKAKRLGLEKSDVFYQKHCSVTLEEQREITKEKLSGANHWNHGQKRPEETIEKIKEAHFELPIEFQRIYKTETFAYGEKEFADALDKKRIKYEHQKILLGKYLADFYLEDINMVVEIDGVYHRTPSGKRMDKVRDTALIASGYNVIHISTDDIFINADKCVSFVLERGERKTYGIRR